jgi:hypothetical protein
VDVKTVVQIQRSATMRALQEYTRLKIRDEQAADLAWRLVLDAMIFQAEAEVRWLDHCEASITRPRSGAGARAPGRIDTAPGPRGGAAAQPGGADDDEARNAAERARR